MKITIGADELILWLRKNKRVENETTKQLGFKILELIQSLDGELTKHDEKCYWYIEGDLEFINEYKLPKTASQYIIDANRIGELYQILSSWE